MKGAKVLLNHTKAILFDFSVDGGKTGSQVNLSA